MGGKRLDYAIGSVIALLVLVVVGALVAQVVGMTIRTDNDRRAMIAARMGDCQEAWSRYSNSQGVSGAVVSSFCPALSNPERSTSYPKVEGG